MLEIEFCQQMRAAQLLYQLLDSCNELFGAQRPRPVAIHNLQFIRKEICVISMIFLICLYYGQYRLYPTRLYLIRPLPGA